MRRWYWKDERGRLIEDALTLPILLMVSLALLNFFLYGVAGAVAQNAAHYAARVGAVAQSDPAGAARSAALQKLRSVDMAARYQVAVQASDQRGGEVRVVVTYRVPNYFRGLLAMFGVSTPAWMEGQAVGVFRHEGW